VFRDRERVQRQEIQKLREEKKMLIEQLKIQNQQLKALLSVKRRE
jgi:parvulin-like peptidyl-prolyl isomerase